MVFFTLILPSNPSAMNENKRQQKVSRLIQKDMGDIFQRDTKGILEGAFVTVAAVGISPDLSIAKIYLSMMLVQDKPALLEKITARKNEIRKQLGNRIGKQMRVVPELLFFVDQLEEQALKMDNLIDGLEIPDESEDKENKDD